MTEFEFKKNIKIVVDFSVGEIVEIKNYSYKVDGKHTIEQIVPNFGGCESGIMVKVSGYGSLLDIGWLTKLS